MVRNRAKKMICKQRLNVDPQIDKNKNKSAQMESYLVPSHFAYRMNTSWRANSVKSYNNEVVLVWISSSQMHSIQFHAKRRHSSPLIRMDNSVSIKSLAITQKPHTNQNLSGTTQHWLWCQIKQIARSFWDNFNELPRSFCAR